MFSTTLCYIEKAGRWLMLHRIRKKNDLNEGKWIGVGGKFLESESPEECLCREVREETGYLLHSWQYRGIITFVSDRWESEHMHLFTSSDFSGEYHSCDEGVAAIEDAVPDACRLRHTRYGEGFAAEKGVVPDAVCHWHVYCGEGRAATEGVVPDAVCYWHVCCGEDFAVLKGAFSEGFCQ